MDDPHQRPASRQSWSTVYRDADRVAVTLLRRDLARQRYFVAPRARSISDTTILHILKRHYRAEGEGGGREECVPADQKRWTPEDRLRVLRHLAEIIRTGRFAKSINIDEHRLQQLWVSGQLPSVEKLCRDVQRGGLSAAGNAELQWLMSTWTTRQETEKAAALRTSQRTAARRKRRKALYDQATRVNQRRLRAAALRGPSAQRVR
ncbi:hypothetical protein [Actinoplanes sp. NPDC051851]|uniref:hypothetical protein n=1 Tax=Actinoplanes sp. NPDC051851 TaxID=3154753 RepID=UPI003442870C